MRTIAAGTASGGPLHTPHPGSLLLPANIHGTPDGLRVVLPLLGAQEILEVLESLRRPHAGEIRILRDPVRWPQHLAVRIINGVMQADNHPAIKIQRGIYACRVIRSFPGRRAALPGQPAGSVPLFGRWPLPI